MRKKKTVDKVLVVRANPWQRVTCDSEKNQNDYVVKSQRAEVRGPLGFVVKSAGTCKKQGLEWGGHKVWGTRVRGAGVCEKRM